MPMEYFEQRERALLGDRFDVLYAAPQETAERGVTVSALRSSPEQFAAKADFRNTIVLLTSNLGARFLAGQNAPLGFAAGSEAVFEKQSAQAVEEAKKWFRPELAGRLDEMIVFRPLADDSLCAIAEKLLCQLEQRAAGSGYQLHHTPQVGRALAAKAHMSMSDYVTACCLGKWIIVIDEQKELLRQLKGIGSNINRLTVLANMGKVQVTGLEKAAGELSEVSAALRAVMEGR